MADAKTNRISRRGLLGRAAAAASLGPLLTVTAPAQTQSRSTGTLNKNSAPSDLKITDMRACTVAANYDYPIIRIDTNQGIYGLGEVFAAGVKGSALMLKAHLVGRNPLEINSILRGIRN